ncbi:MAG: hypothetical protein Rubg2KO_22670 [Rubricoccaceae bacterium]
MPSLFAKRFGHLRQLDGAEVRARLGAKVRRGLSWRRNVRQAAYALDAYALSPYDAPYIENPEVGAVNLQSKLYRLQIGGPFEPYDVDLINRAAVTLLGDAKTVFEAGSGTGMFAGLAADRGVDVTASEFDAPTRQWAEANRAHPNIAYCETWLQDVETDAYDLSMAFEVVEHVDNYPTFLRELARIAPSSILSTPNKARSAFDEIASPPAFRQHVREWTAGEFYWVLRCFWDEVELWTIPDIQTHMKRLAADSAYQPPIERQGLLSRDQVMIAVCRRPRR